MTKPGAAAYVELEHKETISYHLLTRGRPAPEATANLLRQSEKQFMKSDESAFSIVPSNLSSRLSLSTTKTGRNDDIGCDSSLLYRRLSFEDELFTARVYKRNYRNPRLQGRRERGPDPDYETVILQQDEHQVNKGIVMLKPRRFLGVTSTSEISAETAKKNAEENSKCPAYMISMIGGKEVRYQERHLENGPLASRERPPVSPPLTTEDSLGWLEEERRGEGNDFLANTKRIPIISSPLMIEDCFGWLERERRGEEKSSDY